MKLNYLSFYQNVFNEKLLDISSLALRQICKINDCPHDQCSNPVAPNVTGAIFPNTKCSLSCEALLNSVKKTSLKSDFEELSKQRADVHLDFLRTHLITSYALVKMKKQATGQKGKVRSNLAVRRKYSAIWMEVRSYRRTRDRLLALGMAKSDITYKPLLRSDVKPFTVWTDDEVIGDSRSAKKTSWIWEKLSFVRDLRGKEVPP